MKYYIKVGIEHFALGLIIPISIVWKLSNGLTLTQVAFTEGLILLVTALAEIPTGYFADKFGNKLSLLFGSVFQLISVLFIAFGDNITMFIIASIFSGIGWAFISGADEAYLHDDYIENKNEYQKTYSTVSIIDESTTIIGMVTASILLFLQSSIFIVFIVCLVLLIMNTIYIAFILPKSRHNKINSGFSHKIKLTEVKKQVIVLLPLILAFGIIYESGRFLWQPQFSSLGINIAAFGIIFAVLKVASLLGSILARNRSFSTLDLTYIFISMIIALLLFGGNVAIISICAIAVYMFIENYLRIYMSTIINSKISNNRASILSIASFIKNIIGGSVILITGIFAESGIIYALLILVLIKLPAIWYILKNNSSWVR